MKDKAVNGGCWHDSLLESILISYDEIVAAILDSKDRTLRFHCRNFIGISCIGQWDENVIERINVLHDGRTLTESLKKSKKRAKRILKAAAPGILTAIGSSFRSSFWTASSSRFPAPKWKSNR